MKKAVAVFPAVFAISLSLCTSGFAAEKTAKKVFQPSGNVALKYWMADLKTSGGESADQNFFPEIDVEFSPSPGWTGVVQYANSGSDSVSPADPPDNTHVDTDKLNFGVRYAVNDMGYVSLGYNTNKLNTKSSVAGNSMTIKQTGFRVGGGYGVKVPASGWSMNLDLGLGIANDVKYSVAAGSLSTDGSEVDADLTFSYKIGMPGLKADVGYRYYKFKADAVSTLPEMTFKYQGPHIGASLDF